MQADCCGEVLTGHAAAGIAVARVAEVGVSVHVHESVPPSAGQRQPGAEEEAAVTAKHQRRLPRVEQLPDPTGQAPRVVDQRVLVAHPPRGCVAVVDVPPGQHDACVDRAGVQQAPVQAGLPQCFWRLRAPRDATRLWGPQSQVGRRREHGDHAAQSPPACGKSRPDGRPLSGAPQGEGPAVRAGESAADCHSQRMEESSTADAAALTRTATTAEVLLEVNQAHGSTYRLVEPLLGGFQSRAWLVTDASGFAAVLKWSPELA